MIRLCRRYKVCCCQKLFRFLASVLFVVVLFSFVVEDDEGDIETWEEDDSDNNTEDQQAPIIYIITPTFNRQARKPDFIRLAQTLSQVPNIHWIVIEDGKVVSASVRNILRRLITNYTCLAAPTPTQFSRLGMGKIFNKGNFQRNVALDWIRWQYKDIPPGVSPPGVIFFADDDNTYDLRLFKMMRTVRIAGVWPVGLAGGVKLEKPRVDSEGQLIKFDVGFAPNRTFATDMAGFALGLGLILSKRRGYFPLDIVQGWNEQALFVSLDLAYEDLQVFGLNVRTPQGLLEPLVWHTKTDFLYLGMELRYRRLHGAKPSDRGWDV